MSHQLSQAELALRVGLTQTTVSAYEKAAAWPPPPVLIRLSNELGMSLDHLLGRKKLTDRLDARQESRDLWTRFQRVKRLTERDQQLVFSMINRLLKLAPNGRSQNE